MARIDSSHQVSDVLQTSQCQYWTVNDTETALISADPSLSLTALWKDCQGYSMNTDNLAFVLTAFSVAAFFGALFIALAVIIREFFGDRSVWYTWATLVTLGSVSCIYKLSGLRAGLSFHSSTRAILFVGIFLLIIGLP